MKSRERLDKIISSCRERMQEEISALLGKAIKLGVPETDVVSKEAFFEQPAGKSVFAHVQLEGELAGQGGVLVGIRDAIRIGGTLIMLPDSELQAVISEESYTDELEDSYGEIANIICGAITSTFEEQYPKNCRFIRTEQEVLIPVKVEAESDQPIPDGSYYSCCFTMEMEGSEMGALWLVLPAIPFGLVEAEEEPTAAASPEQQATEQRERSSVDREEVERLYRQDEEQGVAEDQPQEPPPGAGQPQATGGMDPKKLAKQQKLINGLLDSCFEKVGEEVGALTSGTFKLSQLKEELYTKEDLLEQAGGKQVMARMEIRGEGSGEAYLLVPVSAAIFLGGSLIMLPQNELEETVRNGDFGEDAEDAYGEICNIIAGVYTGVFEEQYRKQFGFVKTVLETILPIKIDPENDETLPSQLYYLASGSMEYNERELGRLQVVFPAALFELEGLAAPQEEGAVSQAEAPLGRPKGGTPGGAEVDETAPIPSPDGRADTGGGVAAGGDGAARQPDVLIFSDDDQESATMGTVLEQLGYLPAILPFKSAVNEHLNSMVRLVFLVMKEINEQGFGVAIKVSSGGSKVPLVAAGPAWTRTLVIQAVKYGAEDILITPATPEDIREKVEMNLGKIAA
ncbi:hypothetical protein [Desulfogranum mediterraneum]|uniref:hypothetical protein n=1 Tax=Desulfogranum mediterraneum TaxID=160661 RepID=UPI0003F7E012|nr:hypothetical protein [Desulfogranum mediterraneum]